MCGAQMPGSPGGYGGTISCCTCCIPCDFFCVALCIVDMLLIEVLGTCYQTNQLYIHYVIFQVPAVILIVARSALPRSTSAISTDSSILVGRTGNPRKEGIFWRQPWMNSNRWINCVCNQYVCVSVYRVCWFVLVCVDYGYINVQCTQPYLFVFVVYVGFLLSNRGRYYLHGIYICSSLIIGCSHSYRYILFYRYQDTVFVDNEARRFQTLIKETERRFGGREEPVCVLYC